MITSPINTTALADTIKDWLLDQYDLGLIPEKIFNRKFKAIRSNNDDYSRLLLEAINYADNEVMSLLRIDSQCILWMPPNQSELLLSSYRDFIQDFTLPQIPLDEVFYGSEVYLANLTSFADIKTINSDRIYYYNSFPVGKAEPAGHYVLTDFDAYEDRDGMGYHPEAPVNKPCYYEPNSGRLRLPSPAPEDGLFLSFNAFITPGEIENHDKIATYDDYMVRTPYYARPLLENKIKQRVVPENTDLHQMLIRIEEKYERDALKNISQPSRNVSMPYHV